MAKINVEVAPAQVRKLREPFTVTTKYYSGFETLSLEEMRQLQKDIEEAITKYTEIMEGKKKNA